jgi:oligoribonuclease
MENKDNLIWIDLEMTGLDVASSTIIEIAVVITDKDLNELDKWPSGSLGQVIVLDKMDDWGKAPHKESGLLKRVCDSKVDLATAEKTALAFVQKYCPPPDATRKEASPLAGNSVHQDRKFLKKYMPKFEQYTSYRNVDVSTIKELVRRWYPTKIYDKPDKAKHSAMHDILASIEELKHYRKNVSFNTELSVSCCPIWTATAI